ncbi:hypothetical protein [Luteipulveratus halotolerans]|uniref:Uncharacterized protein n=1 Tax=Luteipulveratus halotolerans TaxID=1631356 RepID=A0A0L6CFW5_9MICO|nr:hypothetical protein [Luteipulveratus halotolerans]KNX36721.1 hypothetical protein VV01_05470 [Luteipulveratus halotolerans]
MVLGFAVVDVQVDESVSVWLVSQDSATWAENTNAVTFSGDTEKLSERLGVMIAERYVFTTDRTPGDFPALARVGAAPVGAAVLRGAVTDELARLAGEFQAEVASRGKGRPLVEPDWPTLPGTERCVTALDLANVLRATWTAWLRLDGLRLQRAYLTPADDQPRLLPPAFVEAATVHPLPVQA